ncbi:membrane protein [Beggiatoa sp. PS]|nr:membrane protein [Beggiatoa sp. PS]
MLEALRTRFFVVIIILLALGFGLAMFVGQIAIIENVAYQSSLLAAFLRLSAVYVVTLFVITSMVHEFHNHAIYLWLSMPLQRSTYLIGKFSGFALIAAITALLFGAMLLSYVPYQQVGLWTISLFCELLINDCIKFIMCTDFPSNRSSF